MSRSHCRFAGLLLLILPTLVTGQESTIPATPSENPNEKKAIELLETVATQIPSLRSPENRIALSIAAAELIWSKDEKRARGLIEGVNKELVTMIASIDYGDQQSYNLVAMINQQRSDIIGRIARLDPELALKFLRSTRVATDTTYYGNSSERERSLEFYLARTVAARDPERAVKMARDSIAQGLSYDAVSLLSELRQKNNGMAQELYEAMVSRVKEEDLTRNQQAANVACNLVASFTPPQANVAVFRELLDKVLNSALSMSPGNSLTAQQLQTFQSNSGNIMPLVEKYLPARASALKQWSQSLTSTLDPNNQLYNEINQLTQSGSVDEILALAQRIPVEMRPQVYQQAAWKAANSGDLARARQIATDLISDSVQRRQVMDQIDNQALWKAINEKKLAEARALVSRTTSVEARVQTLIAIANRLASDDKKSAIDCLNEARAALADTTRNNQKMWLQLQVATAYSSLDPDQAFAMVESVLGQLNELVDAAVVMDGFENNYLKNGEWSANGSSSLANMVNNMRRTLGRLGRGDFDRAEALANRIDRPEIRLMAQMDIAQGVLSPNTNLPVKRLVRFRE